MTTVSLLTTQNQRNTATVLYLYLTTLSFLGVVCMHKLSQDDGAFNPQSSKLAAFNSTSYNACIIKQTTFGPSLGKMSTYELMLKFRKKKK